MPVMSRCKHLTTAGSAEVKQLHVFLQSTKFIILGDFSKAAGHFITDVLG